MNRSIIRLFVVVILLFTVLIVWTSRWTVFDATALQNNPRNRLEFFATEKVKRGRILADNGAVLAESVHAGGGTWSRRYPYGSLFAQAIGYNILSEQGDHAGLEWTSASQLVGKQGGLASVFGSFNGGPKVGDDVHTTLDPKAQALARQLLEHGISQGASSGSVVAMVPSTGAVKVLYSIPTYNDNDPSRCQKTPGCSYFIDALQGRYPPGSTFKLVTATAALDTGKYTPDTEINGHSPITVSGTPLSNDDGDEYPYISLDEALTYSVNTVFAQVGLKLGASNMEDYMKRFGFYQVPPLDFPAGQMLPSGELDGNKLLLPTAPCTNERDCVDLGRMSIGQDKLGVTPMQMAMVVSAIANGGKLMEPRLTTRVVNNDGQVVDSTSPQEYDQVMKPSTAQEMTQMMLKVVEEGTGTPAQLEGVQVAGKTGTASTGGTEGGQPLDDSWFVAFAPVQHPKIAVAVELSNIPNGYGATYAAPIAAQVIKTLLGDKP